LSKKRFGISLPENLYEQLNKLSSKLETNRSDLVEQAVSVFINDYKHYLIPHICTGVMIVSCKDETIAKELIDEYSDIAKTYIHTHENALCIEIIFVSGPSEKIALFQKKLAQNAKCNPRYIPVSTINTK
jgi:CopG family nickel-responsive transcriptional regulator